MNNSSIDKVVKFMAYSFALSMCVFRISKAVGNIFLALGILCFLYISYKKRSWDELRNYITDSNYYKYYALLVICMIPSLFFSTNYMVSIREFADIWIYRAFAYLAIPFFVRDKELLVKMFISFIAVETIDATVSVYQVVSGMARRGWGFGGNVMFLAGILAIIIPPTIVGAINEEINPKMKKCCIIALPLLLTAAIMGQSRGLWLTILVITPIIIGKYIIQNKKYLAITLILITAVSGMFVSSPHLMHRVKSITNHTTDRSNADRWIVWESSINMIKDNPLVGVGIGNYKDEYEKGYELSKITQDLAHSHNNFLQIFCEAGFIGFIGYFVFTICMLLGSWKDWRATNNPYALMLFSVWAGFTSFGMIDCTIIGEANAKILWYMSGVLLALKTVWSKKSNI